MEKLNKDQSFIEFQRRFLEGKPLYFLNEFEQVALRWDPETNEYFAKHKGGAEYSISGSSKMVADASLDYFEISEQQFKSY